MIRILTAILIVINTTIISTQTLYKYNVEILKEFNNGSSLDELGIIPDSEAFGDPETPCPKALCFDYKGRLNILDSYNNRIIIYNQDHDAIDAIETPLIMSSTMKIEHFEDYIIGKTGQIFFTLINKQDKEVIDVRLLNKHSNKRKDGFIFINNILFIRLDNNETISYINPGKNYIDNSNSFTSFTDTVSLFDNKEINGLTDYSIDSNGNLFFKDNFLIFDYKSYFEYWDKQHAKKTNPNDVFGIEQDDLGKFRLFSLGFDILGNTYWQNRNHILIFDSDGWLLDYFKVPLQYELTTRWTVAPNGDLFSLKTDFKTRKHILYKIKRQWYLFK